MTSEEAPPSRSLDTLPERPMLGIRVKVLSLVAFSALAPALLVGIASYLTARRILVDKVSSELSAQARTAADQVKMWLEERSSDTEVFASSFVVSENLRRWTEAGGAERSKAASEARRRVQQYLDQVRDRYPLYEGLLVADATGRLLARSGRLGGMEEVSGGLPRFEKPELRRRDGQAYLYTVGRLVRGRADEPLGALVTVSGLSDLWDRLSPVRRSGMGRLRVIDARGRPVLDARANPPVEDRDLATEGVRRCLEKGDGVSEYRDAHDRQVLGAYRFLAPNGVGLLVEINSEEAFAAVRRLRNFNLLIGALIAGLVTALGYVLVVSLSRPIEALTEGAKAVSRGDLSFEIPVSSGDEIGYLTRVFNRMTSALQQTHRTLEELSTTDELTRLFNRRQLGRAFASELARVERKGGPLSLMMIDIDHFKAFNDRYGHLQGDRFLREVGKFLKGRIRSSDVAARYGGEEFVVLLPGIGKEHAGQKAEWLRKDFEGARLIGEAEAAVTISIGVASCPEDGCAQEELIKKADGALYEAKRQGRNRVAVA